MLSKLKGLKPTLSILVFSGFVFSLVFLLQQRIVATVTLQSIDWLAPLTAGLLIFSFFLSAQFSRSRVSWLMLFGLLALAINQFDVVAAYVPQLNISRTELILFGVFVLVWLSASKDRGLLSVHSVYRLFILAGCLVLAKLYAFAYQYMLTQSYAQFAHLNWFEWYVPVAVGFIMVCVNTLRKANLVNASLCATFIVLLLTLSGQLSLVPVLLLLTFAVIFILVVLIDSYFLAYRDELTGLPSRRALMQLSLSLGRKYSLAMLDIDHFKKFNDKYGHDIGDQVLKLVASQLAKVKKGGRVFRYGGEEFTVVFPRKDSAIALAELEALRQSIQDYKMVIRQPVRQNKKARGQSKKTTEKTVSITISIGLAERQSKQGFEQVIKEADLALYRAKKKGRNNVSE